jgi:hypothetical protein
VEQASRILDSTLVGRIALFRERPLMDRHFRVFALALAAAWSVAPSTGRAQVWTELSGTHNTAATAQVINSGPTLTRIVGTFANSNDMDVYRFTITTPASFSASTVGFSTPAGTDTMLFLFTGAGVGIASNDDQVNKANSPNTRESLLPIGNSLYATLTPGQYILAVSLYNNRPSSSVGTIFTNDADGVFGPANSGVFTAQTSGSTQPATSYSITLSGVSPVPEPGTLLLTGFAGLGAWVARRRRRAA